MPLSSKENWKQNAQKLINVSLYLYLFFIGHISVFTVCNSMFVFFQEKSSFNKISIHYFKGMYNMFFFWIFSYNAIIFESNLIIFCRVRRACIQRMSRLVGLVSWWFLCSFTLIRSFTPWNTVVRTSKFCPNIKRTFLHSC